MALTPAKAFQALLLAASASTSSPAAPLRPLATALGIKRDPHLITSCLRWLGLRWALPRRFLPLASLVFCSIPVTFVMGEPSFNANKFRVCNNSIHLPYSFLRVGDGGQEEIGDAVKSQCSSTKEYTKFALT